MLTSEDPAPVSIRKAETGGRFLLTCEHAGQAVPQALGDLGVSKADMDRHIGWDIGALGLAEAISDRLNAPLIAQRYSRLVIDCNRPHSVPGLTPPVSDGTSVPANQDLSDAQKQERIDAIHRPYHQAITRHIDQARPSVLVSVHSFTPHMDGFDRPWHAGFLANRMPEVAHRLKDHVGRQATDASVAYNQPYQISDVTDYTIPVHGEARQLPHVLVEIRNDLLDGDAQTARWAGLLTAALLDLVDD